MKAPDGNGPPNPGTSEIHTRRSNPFPGPRPYSRTEASIFFGRDSEIETLKSLVLSSSAVVVHAHSGTGKSSLIEAGLLPDLQSEGCVVLPTLRLGAVVNSRPSEQGADSTQPRGYLEVIRIRLGLMPSADTSSVGEILGEATRDADDEQLRVLFVDQFEEVLSQAPDPDVKDLFMSLLALATEDNRWRLVFALRSDYLADFLDLERTLPASPFVQYALPALDRRAARSLILSAFASSGPVLAEEDVDALVAQLAGTAFGRNPEPVNAIQLQIVCRRLWEVHQTQGAHPVWMAGGDLSRIVRSSMTRFVDEAVRKVARDTETDEGFLRAWIADTLITPNSRRALLALDERSSGLPLRAIEGLERQRLVQFEARGATRLVEITHDRMVGAIEESNRDFDDRRAARRRRGVSLAFTLLVLSLAAGFLVEPRTPPVMVQIANVKVDFSKQPQGLVSHSFYVPEDHPVVLVTTGGQEFDARGVSLVDVTPGQPATSRAVTTTILNNNDMGLLARVDDGHRYRLQSTMTSLWELQSARAQVLALPVLEPQQVHADLRQGVVAVPLAAESVVTVHRQADPLSIGNGSAVLRSPQDPAVGKRHLMVQGDFLLVVPGRVRLEFHRGVRIGPGEKVSLPAGAQTGLTIDVPDDQLPLVTAVTCSQPTDLGRTDAVKSYQEGPGRTLVANRRAEDRVARVVTASPGTPRTMTLYQPRTTLALFSRQKATCRIEPFQVGRPPATSTALHTTLRTTDDGVGAVVVQPPEDSLLLSPPSPNVQMSVQCRDPHAGEPVASGRLWYVEGRAAWFIRGKARCVVSAEGSPHSGASIYVNPLPARR